MLKLIIPEPLLEFIDNFRGYRSRASYVIKCIDYIKTNNIDINEYYENNEDDRVKGINPPREVHNRKSVL